MCTAAGIDLQRPLLSEALVMSGNMQRQASLYAVAKPQPVFQLLNFICLLGHLAPEGTNLVSS